MKNKQDSLSTKLTISDVLYNRYKNDLITDHVFNEDPMIEMPVSGVLMISDMNPCSQKIKTACYGNENNIINSLIFVLIERINIIAGDNVEKKRRIFEVVLNSFIENANDILFCDFDSEGTEIE